MSAYEPRKKWISKIETKEFKYPVVHSTPKDGHRFVWSNKNDNGFFGIKKVIFGESGIYNPIIDIEGKYAMSQGAMAIIIDDIKEGEKISKFLCSTTFNKIIKACLWSSFRIEWGMFKDLKKNFYELLDDKKLESNKIIEPENIRDEIMNVSKKKTSKIETKITNEDKEIDEIEKIIDDELNDLKVSKRKNALQYLINKIKSNESIELYHGGKFYRDYMFVDDVCRAINHLLTYGELDSIYNIGTGDKIEFLEIIQKAIKLTNSNSKIIEGVSSNDYIYIIDGIKITFGTKPKSIMLGKTQMLVKF